MLDEAKLKDVMGAVFELDPASIGPDASFDSIDAWTSLKHMTLVLALEDAFGVMIPDEDAANITSFALIKLVLEEQLGSG